MTVELGLFALVLALLGRLRAGHGADARGRARQSRLDGSRRYGGARAIAGRRLVRCLMHAYIVSDFSVLTVAANSHSTKPMLYKVAGTWGNHEGSMLLWVLILTIFGGAVAAFGGNLPPGLRARALAVQAWIAAGFYLHRFRVAEDVRRTYPCWRRLHRRHAHAVRLNVPVCGPDAAIEWRLNRQSAVPAEDTGGLPTSKYLVDEATGAVRKALAAAKRKSHDPVGIDDVPGVEIRRGVILVRVQSIDDERRSIARGILKSRRVVERMSVGV